MTSLIDCYCDLSSLISNIHITNSHVPNETLLLESKLTDRLTLIFHQLSKRLTKKTTIPPDLRIGEGECFLSFLWDTLPGGLELFCRVEASVQDYRVRVWAGVLREGVALRVRSYDLQLFLGRYLMRVNGALKYGSILLSPLSGQLGFSLSSCFSARQFQMMVIRDQQRFLQHIQQELLKARYYVRKYIYKILHLMNQMPLQFDQILQIKPLQPRTLSSVCHASHQLVEKLLPFLTTQFPFMISPYPTSKQPKLKQVNQGIRAVRYGSQILHSNLKQILQLYGATEHNWGDPLTDEERMDAISILTPPSVRHENGEPPYIYSQIQIKQPRSETRWEEIDKGGFCTISKATLSFVYKQDMDRLHSRITSPLFRVLVKKEELERNGRNRLDHQKTILGQLRSSVSPFIAKFYHCEERDYKKSLFIQYCPARSLAGLRGRAKEFLSLHTRLILLKNIAQALKFLKDHNICHLDIKPSNILFGPRHIKLSDFGESFHPDVCAKSKHQYNKASDLESPCPTLPRSLSPRTSSHSPPNSTSSASVCSSMNSSTTHTHWKTAVCTSAPIQAGRTPSYVQPENLYATLPNLPLKSGQARLQENLRIPHLRSITVPRP